MEAEPYTINERGGCELASVTDPSTWMTFDKAVEYALRYGMCIGFVLTRNDPYCCIDVDNKPTNPAHPDALAWFQEQATALGSYTELSPSRTGYHTWIKATLHTGARRHPFEVYPHGRYIRCTGWAVIPSAILEAQEFIDNFVAKMEIVDSRKSQDEPLVELEQEYTDDEILHRASTAANATKFVDLFEGRFKDYGYSSQSEADFALLSMLAFYSISNAQVRRLFHQSALGQRAKANRTDYVDRTLRTLRNRQDAAISDLIDVTQLVAKHQQQQQQAPQQQQPQQQQQADIAVETAERPMSFNTQDPPWPPGLIGDVARFIYASAPRPVREVAIVAALGLMAGICGKAWHVSGSGLNMYMILVARSAIGKEAMHSGLSKIVKAVQAKHPTSGIENFVTFTEFVSGQALTKYCIENSSFVNVTGEWGKRLQRFSSDNAHDSSMASLRTAMLNLYQKSGPDDMVGGMSYSKRDDSVENMGSVAYSMIGETTPKTFYDALTETMMEDGFLSRFSVMEYTGDRPPLNERPLRTLPPELIDRIAELVYYANQHLNTSQLVGVSPEALDMHRAFEAECDAQIHKAGGDESKRQMWNRAGLKTYKFAATAAISRNYANPVIEEIDYAWAVATVYKDISIMSKKLAEGDVGLDDNSQQRKLVNVLQHYLDEPLGIGYKIPAKMQSNRIVPHNYLVQRCSQLTAFYKHKLGAREAIRQGIKSMVECGYLKEALPRSLQESFSFHGKAYLILELPNYA